MSDSPAPSPWRFIANVDIPEENILAGDIVVCCAGRPTRILRSLPVNNGLVLNLSMLDQLTSIDGVVGTERGIVEAMARRADRLESSVPLPFTLLR